MKKSQRRIFLGKLGVAVALITTTAVMVVGPASATTAVTLYVASGGPSTTGCTDLLNSCATIQEGVNAAEALANTSVTVHVAAGTYYENVTIAVPTGDTLTLEGAGANSTIADGDGGGVFTINSGVVTIDGFSIEDGIADQGGGVYNDGTATLTNDTLSGDAALEYGGGVYNQNGAILTMTNDTLSGDSAFDGGAVANSGTATLTNDTLSGDSANSDGGAVDNTGGTSTMTNDTLSGDSAAGSGGGVANTGTVTLANSIMDGASCAGTIGDGGYNVESDNTCTTGSSDVYNSNTINLAPSLAANGSSGPETLAIGANSAAFEEAPCTITTDERSFARPGLAGQSCDAGAFEAQSQTVTLHVGGSGTETTGCTDLSNPCSTIQEGVNAAELYVGNVTVDVATGIYAENVTIDVPHGDTLTIEGAGNGLTIANGDIGSVFTISSGVVTIDGFSIEDGSADLGGGVANSGTATLTNDALSNDSATDEGGAVFNDGTITLANDTLSGDSSSDLGGGVYNDNGAIATLTNDALSNDSALDFGGGVWNDGTATLINDTLANNTSADSGGGVYSNATVTLTNDTLSDDSANGNGGGVLNGGIATLTNDTLFGDSANDNGGGVDNTGTVTLTNDTLSDDWANGNGGGVLNGGTATLTNSILDAASCYGTIGDGGHNVESDDSCATGSSDVVTTVAAINLAASLAVNGSSGPETLAIGANSAAFEEVPVTSCTIATDERGEPRPGQLDQSACDAGAYEYQHAALITHQSQSINFGPLNSVAVTTTHVDLSATATSGLAVTFTSASPSVCTVSDAMVSLLAVGTCSITASQAGDAVFISAPSVTESFSVTAAPLALPAPPVIKATSPFNGRLRIRLTRPASGATSYWYSLDGRAWVKLAGTGPFTLAGLRHVTVSVRLRGENETGDGRASNAVRLRVRS